MCCNCSNFNVNNHHHCNCHCNNGFQFRPVNLGEVFRGDINVRRGLRELNRAIHNVEIGLLEMEDGVGINFNNCDLRPRHRHNSCFNSSFNSGHNVF